MQQNGGGMREISACVVKRGGIIEDNSKMPGNFYFSDCSYEPGQD